MPWVTSSSAATSVRAAPVRDGSDATAGATGERGLWPWPVWLVVAAAVLGAAVAFVLATGMTPSFDPYGWLVWGHQILHGRLNLNAAPSWKPLAFIFALPYALFSERTAPKLWSITAAAGTFSMAVFAARIAFRLAVEQVGVARPTRRTVAALIGALFAALGVLGMNGLSHWAFIANSDPLNTAIVLAAVDAHLCRRPRLAYVVLFAAALGRPEVWPLVGLYGLWLIWKVPGARTLVVAGWVLVIAAWFVPTAIWSKSVFQAGTLDLGKATACHTNKILCVGQRWGDWYEWPMQLAGVLGVAVALLRRDRRVLGLVGLTLLWLVIEIAFAYHGFSAVSRYVLEPAAVMVAIAGYGVAALLAGLTTDATRPGRAPGRGHGWRRVAALGGPLVVVGILAAMVPFAHLRQFRVRAQLSAVRNFGVRVDHLAEAVRQAGGGRAILACGEATAMNQYQSQLAWATGVNVSSVYFDPALLLSVHRRMVLFTQVGLNGWTVKAYNVPAPLAARCASTVDRTIPSSGI